MNGLKQARHASQCPGPNRCRRFSPENNVSIIVSESDEKMISVYHSVRIFLDDLGPMLMQWFNIETVKFVCALQIRGRTQRIYADLW